MTSRETHLLAVLREYFGLGEAEANTLRPT